MSLIRSIAAMSALCVLGGPAQSQTSSPSVPVSPSATEQETQLDDIVVNATRLEELVARFVDEVARPAAGRGLARWAGPVCIGVVNFRSDAARHIADGLVRNADALGVPVNVDDCDPNIYIVGAVDAQGLASEWVSRERREFRPDASNADASSSALRHFMTSDRPVRWWHISIPMHYDILTGRAAPAGRFPGQAQVPINVYSKSLLRSRIRDDLFRVVVIVDVEKLGSSTIDQLTDYLTVVAFAQVDPLASTREFPTILNLFDDAAAAPGLTEWDRGYLTAMYAAVPDRRLNRPDQADNLSRRLVAPDQGVTPEVPSAD